MATTPPPLDPAAMSQMVQQQNPQGMTQMGPQMNAPQPRQTQSSSTGIVALVQQVSQKINARKQRETQQTFDRFTQSVSGINQAQSQLQEAQEAIKKNPQDQKAIQQLQQAQQAVQQNRTILDDMFTGAHGEKHAKMLSKGFGIDDKNADTPERKAAMQSIQKSMGVGSKAAGVISQLPQTQQLSPQAQQQQMLQRGGVVGKPATQGQQLQAETQRRGQDIHATTAALQQAHQQGIALDKLKMTGMLKGIDVSRGTSGELVTHVMSPEERAKVPYLKAQDDLTQAKTEAERAITDAKMNPNNQEYKLKAMDAQSRAVDAQARMMAATAAQMRAMTAQAKEPPEVAAARKTADQLETEYAKAQQYVKTPSPTNDTALIFSYVRAQVAGAGRMTNVELQMALHSGAFGTRMSNLYNKATKGELDSDFRQQIADSIKIAADKARLTADKYDTKKTAEGISDDDILKGLQELAK